MKTINNAYEVIDSRDVIERIEELENQDNLDFEEQEEMTTLKALAEQCNHVPDWKWGEILIREDYFVEYIRELIHDCYDLKQFEFTEWPFRHMSIDYEAAAQEASYDYTEVTFAGVIYLLRDY